MIGGGLATAGEILLSPLRQRIRQLVPAMPRIEPSKLGADAAVLGAVRWATDVAQQQLMNGLDGPAAHG